MRRFEQRRQQAPGVRPAASARRRLKLIRSAIAFIEKRIQEKKVPIRLADLIRLVEMESAITERGSSRRVTVAWVKSKTPYAEPPSGDGYGPLT